MSAKRSRREPVHEPWADLGRDLHHLGVANSLEIPKKLYEMGWRKQPTVIEQQITVVVSPGVDTDTHWANGMPRLLTPEAYATQTAMRRHREMGR